MGSGSGTWWPRWPTSSINRTATGPAPSGSSSGSGHSVLRWAAAAAAAGSLYITYRVVRRVYIVLTYSDPAAGIEHGLPSDADGWDHRPLLLDPTLALLKDLGTYDQLAPLAERGSLLVLQPAAWAAAIREGRVPEGFPKEAVALVDAVRHIQQQQQQQQQQGESEGPSVPHELLWMQSSPDVVACLSAGVPLTVVLIGTSHVSKKSAEEVELAVQTLRPDLLFLELDPARASLMYRDNEPDAAPPPSTTELLSQIAAEMQKPGKHDVLQLLLSALYKSLEGQLGVKAGLEFTAARRAAESVAARAGAAWEHRLRTLLRGLPGGGAEFERERATMRAMQRQQQRQLLEAKGSEETPGEDTAAATTAAATAAEAKAAAREGSDSGESQDSDAAEDAAAEAAAAAAPRDPVAPVQIVLGDRPASETLRAMWGALTPWRRLKFCYEIVRGLFEPLDEDFVEAMKDDDLLTALFKEMQESFPELMGPLLHDRNWVLAVGMWRAAAAAGFARADALQSRGNEMMALVQRELVSADAPESAWPAAQSEAAAALTASICGAAPGCSCGPAVASPGCGRCGALAVAVVGKGHMKGVAMAAALLAAAAACCHTEQDGEEPGEEAAAHAASN